MSFAYSCYCPSDIYSTYHIGKGVFNHSSYVHLSFTSNFWDDSLHSFWIIKNNSSFFFIEKNSEDSDYDDESDENSNPDDECIMSLTTIKIKGKGVVFLVVHKKYNYMSVNACAISHQKIDIKKSIVCKWHIKGHSDYKIRHLKAKVEIKKKCEMFILQ